MDARVTWERVDRIYLAQNNDQSSDVVGMVVNVQGLQNSQQFLTGYTLLAYQDGAVLHGIVLHAFGLTCTVQN
jgi:hypothetical protein